MSSIDGTANILPCSMLLGDRLSTLSRDEKLLLIAVYGEAKYGDIGVALYADDISYNIFLRTASIF